MAWLSLGGRRPVLTGRHEGSQRLRHGHARLRLIHLEQGADYTRRGAHCGVQHVHKVHLNQRSELVSGGPETESGQQSCCLSTQQARSITDRGTGGSARV